MHGTHKIHVHNAHLSYRLEVSRNITILRGDSATGKTTLIDMIQAHQLGGTDSGISVDCDKSCVVLNGINWQQNLRVTKDSIIFIDEGSDFVTRQEFAEAVQGSDNYFVIATRNSLFNLPYSINEIYGIRNVSGNRYQRTKRLYSEFYPLYDEAVNTISRPDCAIVEDSNSGFEFFKSIFEKYEIPCFSAKGKSNVYRMIADSAAQTLLVVADGAAFGPEIERVLSLRKVKNLIVYLPESFEWIILKSDVLKSREVKSVLEQPAEYIDSRDYFSWENFFSDFLRQKTAGTKYAYKKASLNPVYLNAHEKTLILKVMPKLELE